MLRDARSQEGTVENRVVGPVFQLRLSIQMAQRSNVITHLDSAGCQLSLADGS